MNFPAGIWASWIATTSTLLSDSQRQLVLPAGNSDVGAPGADLALLAACNHLVVTHGTFSFWAAYLAGGEVVAPTGYSRGPTGLESDVRNAGLGWTWLPAVGTRPLQDV